ncbi:MAG: hypothetical protein B1H08_00290 [Candidatus Omnitrophica bacterium 4484_171]|nr:MAG: hypothetical protein B1H08_00290 [Candidatus Omnitrophica bacterium 4484_171]
MNKVLLHICCGVCAFASIERLKGEGYTVKGFFYNPNIHPSGEYEKRREVLNIVRDSTGIEIIEGGYDPREWFALCEHLKDEPEGGARCSICYRMRLKETFLLSKKLKFDYFTTTLTISPHKKSRVIFDIGSQIGGDDFLAIDFKKKDGFKRTNELARKYNVYRQNYCGCVYSLRK